MAEAIRLVAVVGETADVLVHIDRRIGAARRSFHSAARRSSTAPGRIAQLRVALQVRLDAHGLPGLEPVLQVHVNQFHQERGADLRVGGQMASIAGRRPACHASSKRSTTSSIRTTTAGDRTAGVLSA